MSHLSENNMFIHYILFSYFFSVLVSSTKRYEVWRSVTGYLVVVLGAGHVVAVVRAGHVSRAQPEHGRGRGRRHGLALGRRGLHWRPLRALRRRRRRVELLRRVRGGQRIQAQAQTARTTQALQYEESTAGIAKWCRSISQTQCARRVMGSVQAASVFIHVYLL